jgi:hypothetical protein
MVNNRFFFKLKCLYKLVFIQCVNLYKFIGENVIANSNLYDTIENINEKSVNSV